MDTSFVVSYYVRWSKIKRDENKILSIWTDDFSPFRIRVKIVLYIYETLNCTIIWRTHWFVTHKKIRKDKQTIRAIILRSSRFRSHYFLSLSQSSCNLCMLPFCFEILFFLFSDNGFSTRRFSCGKDVTVDRFTLHFMVTCFFFLKMIAVLWKCLEFFVIRQIWSLKHFIWWKKLYFNLNVFRC